MTSPLLLLLVGCNAIISGEDRLAFEGDGDADGYDVPEDCDDQDPAVFPGAPEPCDGRDNDCDDAVDEDALPWYTDADTDGFGDPSASTVACEPPSGAVEDGTDCDDGDPEVHPGAPERCDGHDDDCDGVTDEEAADPATWYADQDADGWGDPLSSTTGCTAPTGYTDDATDCDDNRADVHPGASEVCGDGLDNDCDGTSNGCDGLTGPWPTSSAQAWFEGDLAGDGVGSALAGPCDADGDAIDDMVLLGEGASRAWIQHGPLAGAYNRRSVGTVELVGESDTLQALTCVGDLNGDGATDLALGAPQHTATLTRSGLVYLALSPLTGAVDLSGGLRVTGDDANDLLGAALAPAGDANQDGVPDLLTAAPGNGFVAFLIPGDLSRSGGAADLSVVTFREDSVPADADAALAGLGDTDGDGLPDLAFGAPGASGDGGVAWVVPGPATADVDLRSIDTYVTSDSSFQGVGTALAAPGDVNGDGYADLLVGAPGDGTGGSRAGAAALVPGPLAGEILFSDAWALLVGSDSGDRAGTSVAAAGDVNRDGTPDLAVGGPTSASGAGVAWLVMGPVSGALDLSSADARFPGEAGDGLGTRLAGAGDADDDGYDDLLVSTPGRDAEAGGAWLFSGGPGP